MTKINPIGALKACLLFFTATALTECTHTPPPPQVPTIDEVGAAVMPTDIAPIKGAPFDMPQLKRPIFPSLTVDMIDRGISAEIPISDLVNQAIDEVSAHGGGTVIIPAGHWFSNRIELKSNVNLHFKEYAIVEFPAVAEGYFPFFFTLHDGIDILVPAAFIYANGADNIAVTGKGVIMGPPMDAEIRQRPNGPSVVEKDIPVDLPIEQRIYAGMDGRTFYRPTRISPITCTHVLI